MILEKFYKFADYLLGCALLGLFLALLYLAITLNKQEISCQPSETQPTLLMI